MSVQRVIVNHYWTRKFNKSHNKGEQGLLIKDACLDICLCLRAQSMSGNFQYHVRYEIVKFNARIFSSWLELVVGWVRLLCGAQLIIRQKKKQKRIVKREKESFVRGEQEEREKRARERVSLRVNVREEEKGLRIYNSNSNAKCC